MSSWSGGGKRQVAGKGWRRESNGPGDAVHSWQSRPGGGESATPSSRKWQRPWLFYSIVGALLLGIFLYVLLIRPAKTPVLMAIGVEYIAPMAPNSWAVEDQLALAELDQTLAITEIQGGFRGADSDGWVSLKKALEQHQAKRRGFRTVTEPLVVYFSMPGVVDEDGSPCLLPPSASPLVSGDWLKIEDVVAEINRHIPADRPKLLVLDSNQYLTNWRLGIEYNTFGERLAEFVATCDVPNLALLTAAAPGQQGWASPQIRGSAFGQYLRLALAGAADREGGDEDGGVSLDELSGYLIRQVGNWSRANRSCAQTPVVYKTSESLNFDLTHSLSAHVLESLHAALANPRDVQPSVSIAEMAGLWSMLDSLRGRELVRYDPLALADFETRLLQLERLAYGGDAYKSESTRLARELKSQLEQAVDRGEKSNRSLIDEWAIANSSDAATSRVAYELASLPLRQYFGQTTASITRQSQTFFDALVATVSGMEPARVEFEPSLIESLKSLPDTQILVAAYRLRNSQLPGTPQYLRSVFDLRTRAQQLAVPSHLGAAETPSDSGAGLAPMPGDERAHYFGRIALETADRHRRLAEDAIFVVSPNVDRHELLSAGNRSLDMVEEIQQQVIHAQRIADRTNSELVYLAEWLSRPRGLSYPMADAEEMSDFLRLVRDAHDLSAALADLRLIFRSPDKTAEVASRLSVMAKSVEQRLQQYSDDFLTACRQLGDARVGAELLSFEHALASPLIPGELRASLLEKRDTIAALVHKEALNSSGDSRSGASSHTAADGTAPQSQTVAETIAGWSESPVLTLLSVGPSVENGSADRTVVGRLESTCWSARRSLREFSSVNIEGATAVDVSEGATAFLDDRLSMSRAEQEVRAAAPFGISMPPVNPVTRLRRFEMQQIHICHAGRLLDVFWHTVTDANAKTIPDLLSSSFALQSSTSSPAFANTAQRLLDAAEQLSSPPTRGVALQISAMRDLVEQRQLASQYGIAQDASSRPILDAVDDVDVEVQVSPHPAGSNLPHGMATILLTGSTNQRIEVTPNDGNWGRIPLPLTSNDRVTQTTRVHNVKASSLDTLIFFRGREYRQQLTVNSLGGSVVQYEPPQYDGQSITLFGEQPKPPSVVFILDCSYSMEAPIASEAGDEPQSQMNVAKSALETMLNELASRQAAPPRVGVWFFGHRVAWFKDTGRVSRKAEASDGPIPNNLAPAEDVERILPLGIFGAQELGYVSKRLSNVSYHGLTPVNLAIIRAIQEFGRNDNNYSKSIIVITDGKNDQFHDTSPGFAPIRETTTNAVTSAWKQTGEDIPIYIVGFGIPDDERGEAIREFQKIADISNGKVVTADSGGDLIDYLRKQLNVQGYTVRGVDGGRMLPVTRDRNSGEETPVELNTRVAVSNDEFRLPMEFQVGFQSIAKNVFLEGGEALEMRVTRNGNDIVALPYATDVIDELPLIAGNSARSDLLLRVHRPRKSNGRVRFRFSIQDQASHFTPRPSVVWIEAIPEGANEPYIFYDAAFEPSTPVPVIGFAAANWPEGAKFARIRFWCAYESIPAVTTIQLSDIERSESSSTAFQTLPQVSGVSIRAKLEAGERGEYNVLVEEKHASNNSSAGAVRVSLMIKDPNLRPGLVSHRFDTANRVARHQFAFRTDLKRNEFAERVSIAIVSAATLKENSFGMNDPNGLRVPIVQEGHTLAPSTDIQPSL